MELKLCEGHNRPCLLKTGTKDGPHKGKSYYICGVAREQCDFMQPASVSVIPCSKHNGMPVELQSLSLSKTTGEKRHFFRCNVGRKDVKNWCGYRIIDEKLKKDSKIDKVMEPIGPQVKRPVLKDIDVNRQDSEDDDCMLTASWIPSKSKPVEDSTNIDRQSRKIILSKSFPSSESQRTKVAAPPGKKVEHAETEKSLQVQAHDVKSSQHSTNAKSDLMLREELQDKLEAQKNLLRGLEVSKLPDGGQRIRQQIVYLRDELEKLDLNPTQQRPKPTEGNFKGNEIEVIEVKKISEPKKQPTGGMRQMQITQHVHTIQHPAFSEIYAAHPQAMTLYGGRMTQDRLRQVGSVTADAIEQIHSQLETCPAEDAMETDPAEFRVPLMVHQRQALAWLNWRENQTPSGGILADDMGLGKTLTMISLILKQKEMMPMSDKSTKAKDNDWLTTTNSGSATASIVKSDCTLIVCPASLVHQWDKEIKRRVNSNVFDVIVYHGPNRDTSVSMLSEADIVLTTYNIISKEVGIPEGMKKDKKAQNTAATDQDWCIGDQPNLLKIAWKRIILDEAHSIKNHRSVTAMSVCRLRAECRWALTGTPIHNDLLDMYSLLRFLRCSPFDEFKVWKRQVDNKSAQGTKRLNSLIKSLLLRRTKEQTNNEGKKLVSLPDKNSYCHEIRLTKEERRVYDLILAQSRSALVTYLQKHDEIETGGGSVSTGAQSSNQNGACNSLTSVSTNQEAGSAIASSKCSNKGGQIILLLLRLRQCCCHLSLLKKNIPEEETVSEGIELSLEEQFRVLSLETSQKDSKEPEMTNKSSQLFGAKRSSTKIDALMTELRLIQESSNRKKPAKSVIVSQWTSMLDIVANHLNKYNYNYFTIQGSVPLKKRSEAVDDFNSNPRGIQIMLVSLRAGGVGLNLIGGNHLFLMDMHWNPALEQQACDRIYRVGQKNAVHIHRYVCKDTVEEKILGLQEKKTSLAHDVLTGAGASSSKLTLADLRMLFGV